MIYLLAYTPANAQSTSSTLNFSINSVINLSLANCPSAPDTDSSSLTLDVDPTASGVFKSNCQNITVGTNLPGYSLSVKASSPNLTYQNPTTLNPKPTIPATTGSFATPITLATNTWGYAVAAQKGFDASYTVDNANNKYAALATTDTEIYQTNSFPAPVSSFTAYYGTKLDLATVAGQYQTTITYTAIGESIPEPPPEIACVSGYKFKGDLGNIIDARTTTANWSVGDTGIATDTRNNQDYCIGKLADNNVWLLDNLKLELTNGMTLEPATTNVTADTGVWFTQDGTQYGAPLAGMTGNFTTSGELTRDNGVGGVLPNNLDAWRQVDPSDNSYCNGTDPDLWRGDRVGDYGSLTGCGYFYNWYTATAGSFPQDSHNDDDSDNGMTAPGSICPANWKLPSGYEGGTIGAFGSNAGDFGNLMIAHGDFTEIDDGGGGNITVYGQYSLWYPWGIFRSVVSGGRGDIDLWGQGEVIMFWTRSVGSVEKAWYLEIVYYDNYNYAMLVNSYGGEREIGYPIRCLVN